MGGFPELSLYQHPSQVTERWHMCYSHYLPPFLKSTYNIVMWHLCVCFPSTLRQFLGSSQITVPMSFRVKEITLNHRAVEHQDNIIGSFCLLVIIGCFLWVALGNILSIEVNVSFCTMAPVPARARGKGMDCVVRICWFDITAGTPAERKRHDWCGDGWGWGESDGTTIVWAMF